MTISIGNAPCSWGVEFANNPANPHWEKLLKECHQAGYKGLELGPIGYMPEDPILLQEKFAQYQLELTAGVVFQPFHNPELWKQVLDAARRTCHIIAQNKAQHLVIIDSISPRRAGTPGRPEEAEKLSPDERKVFVERIKTVAQMAAEEYGLTPSIHSHAGGFVDFKDELELLLEEIDEKYLKLCIDTGHCLYAGFDPLEFMRTNFSRLSYIHFKDLDLNIKQKVVDQAVGFYDACAEGIFCNLGQGSVDFAAIRELLLEKNYQNWCTVEQDCDQNGKTSHLADAIKNRKFLESIGL